MRFRRVAVAAALATAVVVPSAATVAFAAPGEQAAAVHAASRPSRFSGTGMVTAVSGRTVSIKINGKGSALTVTVTADARIRVNGKNAAVADLAVGYGITVNGTRSGADYLASRVEARGKKTKASPQVSPAPSPSASDDHGSHGHGDDD
ncbi:hypothetical protein [Actinoplanes sp. NPDC026619]|uniref:hypothetical protein n=1 Tax=Actinoplanes sp. NPDC026619 TaxID=3155798 RepID=UPI0033D20FEE